jgi:alkanesulfonate monooxygenase SsuD/methylene tetrahydromethanopterin reductase-like flavin-dependent oxidoreductase (luciferase family)
LCGKIADGLMISNMCPVEFTRHASEVLATAADKAGRQPPAQIVQYIACAAWPDRAEAQRLASAAIGEALPAYWSLAERVPAAKSALLRARDLAEHDFVRVVERLRAGEKAVDVLDARWVNAFAIAGTAQDCLAQAQQYFTAGATELALSFSGSQPEAEMSYLAGAADLAESV